MLVKTATWCGRRKRISRLVRRDLRSLLPYLIVALCFVSSATAIVAAERIPL